MFLSTTRENNKTVCNNTVFTEYEDSVGVGDIVFAVETRCTGECAWQMPQLYCWGGLKVRLPILSTDSALVGSRTEQFAYRSDSSRVCD